MTGPDTTGSGAPRPAAAADLPGKAGSTGGSPARRRLLRAMVPKATRGQVLAAVLCAMLGFALVVQMRQNSEADLESLRQSDLVRLLDDASERSDRLAAAEADLAATRDELLSGSNARDAARRAAQDQVATLGILAGTAPAAGRGIELRVTDPDGVLRSSVLLNAVQELRDSGAEAIQVNDVRVTASTYFMDTGDGLEVDGELVRSPYVVLAIGDPDTLSTAMAIPGGVVRSIESAGARAVVTERDDVLVDALRPVREPEYARPASPTESPTAPQPSPSG